MNALLNYSDCWYVVMDSWCYSIPREVFSFNSHSSAPILQATAWIGTVILDVLTVVYFVLLCSYCRRQWCLGRIDEDQQFKPLIMSTFAETEV